MATLLAGAPVSSAQAPQSPAVTLPVLPTSGPSDAPASPPTPAAVETAPSAPAPPISTADASADDGEAIVVTARRRAIAADPLVAVNAASFAAVQAVDKVIVGPAAHGYEKAVPKPVRNGLRNVLINLAEPIVAVNFLLQFKPGKAFETIGRFAVNSTVGVVGLFDMAKRKPFHLPYRPNGFANTFAYHGIGNGPFLFVPVLGPTTVRDLIGRFLDLGITPAIVGSPFDNPAYGLVTGVVKSMNDRVAFDKQIKKARSSSDPYAASRDFYLKQRQAEINALHSPEWRRRKGIADPVLPPIAPHVEPGQPPETSIPSSMGMVPAAPAPDAPVPGTPALAPAPAPK